MFGRFRHNALRRHRHRARLGVGVFGVGARARFHHLGRGLGKRKRTSFAFGGTKRRRFFGTVGSRKLVRRNARNAMTGSDAGVTAFKNVRPLHPRVLRSLRKIMAPRWTQSVAQQRVTSTVSQQQPVTLTVGYNGLAQSQYLLTSQDFNMMFQNLNGDETVPAAISANVPRKLVVRQAKVKHTIKNQTNIPVEITLYTCMARRDAQNGSNFDPTTLFNGGISLEQFGVGSTLNSLFPGATPFMSEEFCQYWKVKKVTKFNLHPGSEHKYFIVTKPGKIFNENLTSNDALIMNTTIATIMVVKGGLVQDTSTPFNVTYGTAEVDVISEAKYEFMAVEKSRTLYNAFTNLPASVTVQGTVLEDTDAIAVDNIV